MGQLAGVTLAMGCGFDSTVDLPDGRDFAAELVFNETKPT